MSITADVLLDHGANGGGTGAYARLANLGNRWRATEGEPGDTAFDDAQAAIETFRASAATDAGLVSAADTVAEALSALRAATWLVEPPPTAHPFDDSQPAGAAFGAAVRAFQAALHNTYRAGGDQR
jgi:hypothetical protein